LSGCLPADSRTRWPARGRRTRDLDGLRMARSMQSGPAMTSVAILSDMRALLLEPDREWLEDRRRSGLDRRDEVWEGVLHVVPPPASRHQLLQRDLIFVLARIAEPYGLEVCFELSVYPQPTNYRIPDVTIVRRENIQDIGCVNPEIVIEVLSSNDESRDKFPFYAAQKIGEIWLVDPNTRVTEVYVLRGGAYFAVLPNRAGIVEAPRLGLELSVTDGPRLHIVWDGGSADV
jgi:Uma2 family endonuclease